MKCQYSQCNAYSMKDSNYCFRHNPDTNEARTLASRKGGQNRVLQGVYGEEIQLNTPQDVKSFLGVVISGVWTGQVPVPVGSSMGFLTRCWLDAHEATEVQVRLDDLEKKLEGLNNEHK